MDDYLSSEESWRGRFWLPGNHENEQRGVLTYTPDKGVRLTLIGGFDDAVWEPTGQPHITVRSSPTRQWPVIHGVVGTKPVTLLDCIAVSSTSYLLGREVAEQELRVAEALMGVLLDDPDRQAFSGIKVEVENLTAFDASKNWGCPQTV